jgi:formamidopyrimidine-DNA glycosylase
VPELPEVETMRRGILSIVGSGIAAVERPRCKKRPISISPQISALNRRLVGRTVTAVERLGKRVIIVLDSSDRLVIEPRMTGLVLLADPPTIEHLRLRIQLSSKKPRELLFWDRRGLGVVRLMRPSEFEAAYGTEKLGPDALAVSVDELRARLGESRRAVKVALLDQRAIAGIGNLYASEILHLAGVDPQRRCDRLTRDQWTRIHAATLDVLNLAIRFEGSTLSDGTYRNALNQAGGYQNHHRVYDRAGDTCPTCRSHLIQRIVQAQRSTFFCRGCQSGRRVTKSRMPAR